MFQNIIRNQIVFSYLERFKENSEIFYNEKSYTQSHSTITKKHQITQHNQISIFTPTQKKHTHNREDRSKGERSKRHTKMTNGPTNTVALNFCLSFISAYVK